MKPSIGQSRTRDVQGKAFVFAGGTSGIGRVTALETARRGADVLVLGRDPLRGKATVEALRAAGAGDARWKRADLSSMAGVAAAAEVVVQWRERIDGLVHSAMNLDLHEPRRRTTPDGYEYAFGLQYLSRAALNHHLVGAIAASGDGRIIHIGADPPAGLLPDIDDLQFERRKWTLMASLMSSQVLGFLHVQEASRRWNDRPVTIALACVGPTSTDTIRAQPWWVRALYGVIATTPERSAANAVRFLLEEDVRVARGAVFRSSKKYRSEPIAYEAHLAAKVWEVTEKILSPDR
ncbi:MAG: SDR family oxidoreductase [Polyangiaceae bacterium]|nr:SDR family oxidoreductase [Polyangiaceae bacterium]